MPFITEAHVAELQRQNQILAAQVVEMRAFINSFPQQITAARLDAKQGKPTRYDYDRAAYATRFQVA